MLRWERENSSVFKVDDDKELLEGSTLNTP